jgi:serine/threonine-protein kinase
MADDARVEQLLDQLFDSNAAPEEVCGSFPELLPVVRNRWRQMRRLRADLNALFPRSDDWTPYPSDDTPLPRIPGYEVESVLGRGGMGVVFRARHLRLNRPVALKTILDGGYAGPRERARFQREAEAVASLRHPNVVQVYDVGEVDGRPYLAMELIEGGSLAQKLSGTPQSAHLAPALVAKLAEAMQSAHDVGIVHRDLKPANVLMADCTPKISDFGLARRLEGEAGITQSGVPVGTPSYMAPEQARGQTHAVGPAADVYALGAILYECLTGRPPFRAATAAETIQQVISQEPAPPSRLNDKVPRDLDTICLKCLSKEPERRYVSAAALAEDLQSFGEGRPIQARPVSWAERSWRWGRRNPMATALLATALALVGLASGGGVWIVQQRADRREEALKRDWEMRSGVNTNVTQAESLRKAFRFREARKFLEQARQQLGPAGSDDLRQQVDQCWDDLVLAERLDMARIKAATLASGTGGLAAAEPLYIAAFAEAGLGRAGDDSHEVSGRVRASALSEELIAALDDWASITADRGRREWLLGVARETDKNPKRNHLREPDLWQDGARLTQIAQEPIGAELSPQLAIALARAADLSGGDAIPLLTAVQARYPQDYWINFGLGVKLVAAGRRDEAIGYYRAALAVRPDVSVAHNNLGDALYTKDGKFEAEAIGHFNEALRLDRNCIVAHISLSSVLVNTGRLESAVEHIQQALQLDPKLAVNPVGLSAKLADATRSALLAAAGKYSPKGRQIDDAERTRWRLRALGWLQTYLELAIKLQDSGKRAGWSPASWQTDPALASARDPTELAKLPDAEREQWRRLWADVAKLVAADPVAQGRAFAARRDWANAAGCYARAVKHDATVDGHNWFEYAAVLLLSGDRPGYVRACAHMAEWCGKPGGPRAYHVARACTLGPDATADAALPGRLAEKELQINGQQFWSLTEQGALAYRTGQFQESAPLFERSLRANSKPGAAVLNCLWLALADHRLGKTEVARRWLDKAQAWLDQFGDGMPADADEAFGLHLHNWLEAHVLRREAEALIQPKGP